VRLVFQVNFPVCFWSIASANDFGSAYQGCSNSLALNFFTTLKSVT
jgi:hypothetical protein